MASAIEFVVLFNEHIRVQCRVAFPTTKTRLNHNQKRKNKNELHIVVGREHMSLSKNIRSTTLKKTDRRDKMIVFNVLIIAMIFICISLDVT
jgi:hypothetical protein